MEVVTYYIYKLTFNKPLISLKMAYAEYGMTTIWKCFSFTALGVLISITGQLG